jgi:hypothetical protein
MKQLSSHQYGDIYKAMGINVNELGCVMLDLDGSKIEDHIDPQNLYFSKDKQKFWIKGFVAGKVPHVTLLYGLLKSATLYKKYIDQVLTGWELKSELCACTRSYW